MREQIHHNHYKRPAEKCSDWQETTLRGWVQALMMGHLGWMLSSQFCSYSEIEEKFKAGLNMSTPKVKVFKVFLQPLSHPISRAESDRPSVGITEGIIRQTNPDESELLCPAAPLGFWQPE